MITHTIRKSVHYDTNLTSLGSIKPFWNCCTETIQSYFMIDLIGIDPVYQLIELILFISRFNWN